MKRFVEDYPSIDIGFLRRQGLFTQAGRSACEFETKIGRAKFNHSSVDDFVVAELLNASGKSVPQRIGLRAKALRFGERLFFICPLTKDPVSKLYIVNGVLGSREGHGLVHLSRSSSRRDRQLGLAFHITERLKGTNGKGPARGRKRRALILELQALAPASVDQEAAQLMSSTIRADKQTARADKRGRLISDLSTESALARGLAMSNGWTEERVLKTLRDQVEAVTEGWAPPPIKADDAEPDFVDRRPQLDIRTLDKAGLLQPGRVRGAALKWGGEAMGILSYALLAADFRDPARPFLFICGVDAYFNVEYPQVIELTVVDGRTYMVCPLSGARAKMLYLSWGRFGSRKALGLYKHQPRAPTANGSAAYSPEDRQRFLEMLAEINVT